MNAEMENYGEILKSSRGGDDLLSCNCMQT